MTPETEQRLLEALHHYYSAQTIEKWKLLAKLTRHTHSLQFEKLLPLLGLFACILWEVEQQSQLPLQGPEDVPAFTEALSLAREHIRDLLIVMFPPGPSLYPDVIDRYGEWLDTRASMLSDSYHKRLATIESRGNKRCFVVWLSNWLTKHNPGSHTKDLLNTQFRGSFFCA